MNTFEINVYFDEMIDSAGEWTHLNTEEPANAENISRFVSFEDFHHSCWWAKGKLFVGELREWLLRYGIKSDFFQTSDAQAIPETNSDQTIERLLHELNKIIDVDLKTVSSRLITNNYLMIGVLLEFILGDFKDEKPTTQGELVGHIVARYYNDNIKGLSERNCDDKLAKGNKVRGQIHKMLDLAKECHNEAINDC